MHKHIRLVIAMTLASLLQACGEGPTGPPLPPPPPTPAGPSRANIAVAQEGVGQLGFSPLASFSYRVQFQARIQESAGLGANMNFVRLSFLQRGTELERSEIGADVIARQLGSNHLGASATITPTFKLDFNATDFDQIRLEFNFTDDRGNVHAPVLDDIRVTFFPGFIPERQ